jgi:hypothetical protein
VPPSGAGPAGGRRRKVGGVGGAGGLGVGVNQGGVVGGGRIRARGEASWEARGGKHGGGDGKGSATTTRGDVEGGWDAGTPAWPGMAPQEAVTATLRYRREVIRSLPSVLYVDDIAVGDAERGPEMSQYEVGGCNKSNPVDPSCLKARLVW